jgi:hypothetical protein
MKDPGSRGGRRFLINRFPMINNGILINATMRRAQAKEMFALSSRFPIIIGPEISSEMKLTYKDSHPLIHPTNIYLAQVLVYERSSLECRPTSPCS